MTYISASVKKFMLAYGLHIILVISILRLFFTFQFGGEYRHYELMVASVALGIIMLVMYMQYEENRRALDHAHGLAVIADDLAKTNVNIAEKIKLKSDVRQKLADKSRTTAEDAFHFAEKSRENAEIAAQVSEKANRAKSDFLANMSHEIRTPMNAVIGLTHILQTTHLDEKQRKCVDVLQNSSEALMVLINDLLDIDRMEAQSIVLENAPFNMTTLLDQVVSVMSVRAKEKKISLSLNYETGLFKTFIGDGGRIRQIVLNLVGNAIKFTPAEGSVSIFFANGGKGNGKKKITITIADTGIGIAADKMDVIFGRFVQADSSITRQHGGTGLGLAISQTLAKLMGGFITVTSELGVGSSFVLHLTLPVEATTNVREKHYEENIIYLDKQANADILPLLLVEDYEPNIMVATIMFENFGYHYEVARNGQEAIQKFTTGVYSIVLMDVQMPIMDGFETTRRIREFETKNNRVPIKIIAMTAHAMKGDREKCLEAGMDDYIAKPFNPHQLQTILTQYVQVKDKKIL
jgi:signal transduction histidine kinase/CheY-like chemotaxis protein